MRLRVRTWPIWEILFPPFCETCGGPLLPADTLFCAQCWANAPGIDPRDLPKLKHVDLLTAVYHFSETNLVRAAVHALKYEGFTKVGDEMARRMLLRIPKRFCDAELAWSPVPQHWARRMDRSFNQSKYLADALARELHRPRTSDSLIRIRNTPTQTARSYRDRAKNVRDAFSVSRTEELPKSVLLIDDVITTGATMDECARTFKQAGVEWVGAFAFALAGKST